MPHKVNARNCERICGFSTILGGYVTMTAGLAGHQWNEGDVSCSVVRRVALPDAFFALDGLLETFLTVLQQMEVFPAAIAAENERNLPFLATTTILMEAVKHGAGRETAHDAIKEHALAPPRRSRAGGDADLLGRLAGDKRIGLGKKALQAILAESDAFRRRRAAPGGRLCRRGEAARESTGAADYRPASCSRAAAEAVPDQPGARHDSSRAAGDFQFASARGRSAFFEHSRLFLYQLLTPHISWLNSQETVLVGQSRRPHRRHQRQRRRHRRRSPQPRRASRRSTARSTASLGHPERGPRRSRRRVPAADPRPCATPRAPPSAPAATS